MKLETIKSLIGGTILIMALGLSTSIAQTADSDVPSEAEAAETKMHHERKDHMRKMMKKRHKHMEKRMGEHLTKIDANGDGKVDLNEYLANAEQRFNDMDLDGDQLVTQEEAREAHKQMRAKKREEHRRALGKHYDEAQITDGSE